MARETKAQIAEREASELAAQQKAEKAAQRKAEKLNAAIPENKTVVVDFSPEVKELLKALTIALSAPAQRVAITPIVKAKEETPKVIIQELFPAEQVSAPTVSLTEIRGVIKIKADEKKTSAIVKLLSEYGAANAQSLEEKDWDEFYEKLQNL